MERTPEAELMLGEGQALDYALADFSEPHGRFMALLRDRSLNLSPLGVALDLGCGPGDISRRFASAFEGWSVDAVDGSPAMIELGRRLTAEAGLASRVRFHERLLPVDRLPIECYLLVFSNSLLHHLRDPAVLWTSIRRWAAAGAFVFVMDLLRPANREAAGTLVENYAANEPEHLRADFFASLLAAYRPDEVRCQLQLAGLGHFTIEVVTDRHFIVWGMIQEDPQKAR